MFSFCKSIHLEGFQSTKLLDKRRKGCKFGIQCDKAQKGESLTILGPTDKVPHQESLGLGFESLF